jgi:NAD/NADP transhydrogenase beta subunit
MSSMAGSKVFIPEVIEPDEKLPPDLLALRRFATLMDEAVAIPGTGRRVGLDAALGLIPGVGDIIAGLLSAWIVIGALRHRVPLPKVLRMVVNILIDIIVGAVPFLGDVFDFFFEENMMNMRLLMQYRDRRRPPRSVAQIGLAAALVIAVILFVAIGAVAAVIAAIVWLIGKR